VSSVKQSLLSLISFCLKNFNWITLKSEKYYNSLTSFLQIVFVRVNATSNETECKFVKPTVKVLHLNLKSVSMLFKPLNLNNKLVLNKI